MRNFMRARILVVDDEKSVHETVKDLLGTEQYEFRTCFDKEQAEALILHESFDLAIIDLKLSDKLGDESGFELLKILQEVNHKMPVIVITQYYMDPDMIVKCMRSGAYYYFIKDQFNKGSSKFIKLVEEAIKYIPDRDIIEDEYPHPIAMLYRDCKRNVVATQRKFERLIQLLEVTLKFNGIVCLADLIHRKNIDNKTSDFIKAKMNRPSLGHWSELVRQMDSLSSKNDYFWLSEVLKVFTPKLRKSIDELIHIRNENIGHGATKSESEYFELVEKCEPVINQLLQRSRIVGTWKLILVKSSKKLSENEYQHSIIKLNGHNPKFLITESKMPHNLIADKVYVFDPDTNQHISLHPLIVVANCPRCMQETMFFYDKFDRDNIHYLDYVNGHHYKSIEFYRDLSRIIPLT